MRNDDANEDGVMQAESMMKDDGAMRDSAMKDGGLRAEDKKTEDEVKNELLHGCET
eukprot:CAMPEP_0117595486 /NCGR_PEP_ID=MMETSP0784-20121206/73785_1 /TAXON_ID=39447 /ORGANISM="" /LENGTH=55 /DNA_ID=CAMNT_0005397665 /DNA_START=11 /DNA_END=178 /DNA_ORIENTATION=-